MTKTNLLSLNSCIVIVSLLLVVVLLLLMMMLDVGGAKEMCFGDVQVLNNALC